MTEFRKGDKVRATTVFTVADPDVLRDGTTLTHPTNGTYYFSRHELELVERAVQVGDEVDPMADALAVGTVFTSERHGDTFLVTRDGIVSAHDGNRVIRAFHSGRPYRITALPLR